MRGLPAHPSAHRQLSARGYTANPRVEPQTQAEWDDEFNALHIATFGDPTQEMWDEYRLEQQDQH